jgi:Flp pilus assembly pilin Flp
VEIDGIKKMMLPPDVEVHEDIRLLVYRPRGVLNRAAVNKIITVIGELETTLKEPFNRFSDTVEAHAVDLNFEYIIRVSLYRRRFYGRRPPIKSAILATNATAIHYGRLHALLTQGFTDQSPRIPRPQGSGAMARCASGDD